MKHLTTFKNAFAQVDEIFEFKKGFSLPIYRISSYHTLVQFIGYAKYLNRNIGNVYLRGQHKMYSSLIPSIFRNISKSGGFSNRNKHIGQFVTQCAKKMKFIADLDDIVREPVLQHYGIGTRWIDLVDNVWVALWFGIHEWHTQIYAREYKNVVPRKGGPV